MRDELDQDTDDAAAEAFEAVRGEVALLRRAVERLAAERAEGPEPVDYSETLARIMHNVTATAQRVDVLTKSPALSMTPAQMGGQITAAAGFARQEDQRLIATARKGLEDMTRQLQAYVVSGRTGDEQNRWLAWTAIGGVILGIALCAAFGGALARATPDSWRWPESMAARTLGGSAWDGARRLAGASYPDTWNAMVAGVAIGQGNEDALERCQRAANKAEESVRCTVRIRPEERR